ncbi:MAG TPA: hypothetical protein VKY26_02485 [Actinomycetota bacterium]|nr:hypothetical protein [Actinomycetota bacterium]
MSRVRGLDGSARGGSGARGRAIGGLAVAALVAVAACAKTTTAGSASSPSPSPSPAPDPAITISVAPVPGVGTVLVNGNGMTLYLLTAEQGGTLACTSAACLHAWPEVTLAAGVSAGIAGAGITPTLLGTVKDAAGGTLVSYGGWPLHTFVGDSGPGTAKGQGLVSFGGTWEVLTASGTGVAPAVPSPVSSAASSPASSPGPSPVVSHAPAVVPTHGAVVPTPTHTPAPLSGTSAPPATTAPPSPAASTPPPQPTYSYGYGY